MPRPEPDEYLHSCWFSITLDGPSLKEEMHFKEAQGLDILIDVTEYQMGGKNDGPVKLPGMTRYTNIVLKRGITKSKKFFEWITKAVNGKVERCGGKIALLKRDGSPVMEWTFKKAFPCRYEGPSFDAETGGICLETLEIAHEGLTMAGG